MTRKGYAFFGMVAIMLILGLLLTPVIPLVFGLAILYLSWSIKGGMAYGNPHRRKAIEEGRSMLTRSYYGKQKPDKERIDVKTDVFFFFLGLGMIVYSGILLSLGF